MFTTILCLALAATDFTVVDDVGRTIHLATVPQRIVSTAPSNTAALFALGVGPRVVGVTSYCTYPDDAKKLPKVGDFSSVDLELLVSLKPDLVVATWLEQQRSVERMEALGLNVLVLYPKSLDAMLRSLLTLGKATGSELAARRITEGLEQRLRAIDREVQKTAEKDRPRVFVQLGASPLYTAGSGSTVHEAIERAGGRNIAADVTQPYATIAREIVIARDPQVVLLGMGSGDDESTVAQQAGFAGLSAVRDDRVYVVDPGLLFQQNQRLVDGIELLVQLFQRGSVSPPAAASPTAR